MATDPATQTQTLYGAFPTYLVSQRASSVQATSLAVTSSSFGATQAAMLLEVANTLIALGFWKGSA